MRNFESEKTLSSGDLVSMKSTEYSSYRVLIVKSLESILHGRAKHPNVATYQLPKPKVEPLSIFNDKVEGLDHLFFMKVKSKCLLPGPKSLILDRYYFHPRVCVCLSVCPSIF